MRLDGIRVLDLSHLLPGPYATQLLADSGAEVVKVEPVDDGDAARNVGPFTSRGTGSIFEMVNRGKRSVAIDLKSERGQAAFYRLVERADVVFEQFRPGVSERLGIDSETLTSYNDSLIYCSLTGYGQNGPWSDRAGHDLNYIGLAGLLDMTRESPTAKPQMPGYPVADMAGGSFAAFAIVEALLARELGNAEGSYVDVAMADVVASFSQSVAYQAFTGDPAEPRPGETHLSGGLPWYDVYETADGKWVTLAALEKRFWRAFCEAVDRDDLIERHGSRDPAELKALESTLSELFQKRTRGEWETMLDEIDVAFSGVYTPSEMVDHPQISEREIIEDSNDRPPRIGFPARRNEAPESVEESVPELGEHTAKYLSEVGYDSTEIDELRQSNDVR